MSEKPKIVQEDPASWLATFGDLATLLLTFYVLIFATSSYQPGDWETAEGAIQRMMGLMAGQSADAIVGGTGYGALNGGTGVIPLLATVGARLGPRGVDAVAALEELLSASGSRRFVGHVGVEVSDESFLFRLAEPISFQPGGTELMPGVDALLGPIARIIRATESEVVIEGHTDDQPVGAGRFASNWELSGARAARVARALEGHGAGDARIVVRAAGEHQPLFPNESAEARRLNRRVEIRLTFLDIKPAVPEEAGSSDG